MKTNDNDEGHLVIFYASNAEGRVDYRARGTGPVYAKFYAFLRGASYISVDDDFPWDYFYIKDYSDEVAMINKFGKYMAPEPK